MPALGSVFLAAINLLPFQRGTQQSDGKRLLILLRRPMEARRWLALVALIGELEDGIDPESLSSDFIDAATGEWPLVRDVHGSPLRVFEALPSA